MYPVTVAGTYNYTCTPHGINASFTATPSSVASEVNTEISVLIYPNPSNGKFTINTKGNLTIYNSLGEKVLEQKVISQNTEINLCDKPQGVYFIKMCTVNGTSIFRKLIIQ